MMTTDRSDWCHEHNESLHDCANKHTLQAIGFGYSNPRERELENRAEAAEAEVKRLREALRPLVRPHCGLCVPVDDQGRLGEVTPESCVCDPAQKRARAALAATKGE